MNRRKIKRRNGWTSQSLKETHPDQRGEQTPRIGNEQTHLHITFHEIQGRDGHMSEAAAGDSAGGACRVELGAVQLDLLPGRRDEERRWGSAVGGKGSRGGGSQARGANTAPSKDEPLQTHGSGASNRGGWGIKEAGDEGLPGGSLGENHLGRPLGRC